MATTQKNELYSPLVEAATKHARWRLLPFLMLMFVIAFIDRSNIGFAQEELEIHAGLSAASYALGAGLFFIGYAVFEVPSNLIMHKVGARWWMARIMITWGIIAAMFMFVDSETWFYSLRFLLGVAEAGFFPGVILYLTYWFPVRKRGQATGLFYMGLPIANMVGGPLSGGLLEMDGILGLFGFQWMFLIEGLLAVVIGVVAFFYLTDRPEQAKWLPDDQREALVAAIAEEEEDKHEKKKLSWAQALGNGRVLYFALVYMTIQFAVYGLTFFLPKQVSLITGQKVGFEVGLLVAIPWTVALIGLIFMGRLADRTGRYRAISTGLLIVSGLGITASALTGGSPVIAMISLCFAALGFVSAQPLFWNIPTAYLSGAALAAGVGLINGLGNLGGFLAPQIRVWAETTFATEAGVPNESAGLFALAIAPFLGALLLVTTRVFEANDRKAQALKDGSAPRV